MKGFRKPSNRKRGGFALLMVGFALFVGAGMTVVLLATSTATSKESTVHRREVTAWYLAEGGIEVAKKQLIEAIADYEGAPTTGTTTIGDLDVEYTIEPTGFQEIVVDNSGIQTTVTGYEITARAEVEGIFSMAHRVVNVEETPIFQFAVFYDDDLEIFPGPNMRLGGRVHSNSDMFLGSGGTLTVDTNYCRAIGDIYRHRKDDPSQSPGTVAIRKWVKDPYDASEPAEYVKMLSKSQFDAEGVTNTSGYDSNFTEGWDSNGDGDFYDANDWLPWGPGALDLWSEPDAYLDGAGSTVKSAAHGTSELKPPSVGSVSMYEEVDGGSGGDYSWSVVDQAYVPVAPGTGTHEPGYFHANADLSIITYADGSWAAFDADGDDVTGALSGVVDITTMLDTRQSEGGGQKIDVTEIDMELLSDSGVFPDNGLLYTSTYGAAEGTDAAGIVLTNGSELKGPLTVVSENSVYVHGDYNTDGKQGAAVIADSINLLSNDWDGSKSTSGLPKASETTFNLAFITGNLPTQGSAYNGGLENLPRFHENWSGINCNLNGSFVNPWESTYATAPWVYGGNRYTAPNRVFTYDEDFNDAANLPPFTPMAVSIAEVVSW